MRHDDLLARHDIGLVRAANPGPLTLSGTNTWLLGRDPCWIVDPGPDLEAHVAAVAAAARWRGGAGGIALTHHHGDHADALDALQHRLRGVPVAAHARDGDALGPLTAVATPGHSAGHVVWLYGDVCCTGDAVLGEGSVFLAPAPRALTSYLAALRRLRALDLALLLPGHGPPVGDAAGKLDEYLAHRLEREARLVAALAAGRRTVDELLDAAWSDVPAQLRPAAAITLAAHLDKLGEEGRLPDGVERPEVPAWAREA